MEKENLIDVTIVHLDKDYNLIKKLFPKRNIKNKKWILEDVKIFTLVNDVFEEKSGFLDQFTSNYEKLIVFSKF